MNYERTELLDKLAAEYVLGTLTGPARRRFERLVRTSPGAAKAVVAWQRRLMPLACSLPDAMPPERVWRGIEQRLDDSTIPARPRRRWGDFLRPVAMLALGLVMGVTFGLGLMQQWPPPASSPVAIEHGVLPESYVGVLTDAGGEAALLAGSRRQGKELFVKLVKPLAPPPGQVAVLWALPVKGAPFPLGVVPASNKSTLTMADTSERLLNQVTRLGVSFETGLPGPRMAPGPFVLQGHCVKLW
jgi:anti-sigma-K factor RskA